MWIMTADDGLINLDHVKAISVVPSDEDNNWKLIIDWGTDYTSISFETKEEAEEALRKLAQALRAVPIGRVYAETPF